MTISENLVVERSSQILNTNDFAEMIRKFCNFHRKGSRVKYCWSLMNPHSCCVRRILLLNFSPHRPGRPVHTIFFSVLSADTAISIRKMLEYTCPFSTRLKGNYLVSHLRTSLGNDNLFTEVCGKRLKSCIGWIWVRS